MRILISACLVGCACRYDGKSKPHSIVEKLAKTHELIPFCPEIYGGLPTPRPPSEIVGERVVNSDGVDVTAEYVKGANEALMVARVLGCGAAVLKTKSPSCGKGEIYDGSFTKTLKKGDGVTARLLMENGIAVFSEEDCDSLIAQN
ncbi:MAG: DUF523 domain-containing protein [Clostridia bacterium]|nr:DUF523 domain-containing protein [Clostridia bacterium]